MTFINMGGIPGPCLRGLEQAHQQHLDKTRLKDMSDAALEDGTLTAQERDGIKDLLNSGAYEAADLEGLPPEVQALFDGPLTPAVLAGAPTPSSPAAEAARVDSSAPADASKLQDTKTIPAEKLNTDPNLSEGRRRMMGEVAKVIGSAQGQNIAPLKLPDAGGDLVAVQGRRNLFEGHDQKEGTSCGLLPGAMLQRMGINGANYYGPTGIEVEARRMGIFVEGNSGESPNPGDIYVLRSPLAPGAPDPDLTPQGQPVVTHVGIVNQVHKNETGNVWETADAGQGTKGAERAELVSRTMLVTHGSPTSPGRPNVDGEYPTPRRVGGWVDMDKLNFLNEYQYMLQGGVTKAELDRLVALAKEGGLNDLEKQVLKEITSSAAVTPGSMQPLPSSILVNREAGNVLHWNETKHLNFIKQSALSPEDLPEDVRAAVYGTGNPYE